jgi:hypothetical protein
MNYTLLHLSGSALNHERMGESKLPIFNILRYLFVAGKWNTGKAATILFLVERFTAWLLEGWVLKLYFC